MFCFFWKRWQLPEVVDYWHHWHIMVGTKFDLKLIPKFNGSTSMVDWVESVELTCPLYGVKQVELVIICLRLTGGALDVYQRLSDNEKADVGLTKAALYKGLCDGPLHSVQTLYYLDINGRWLMSSLRH